MENVWKKVKDLFKANLRQYTMLIALIVIILLFEIITNGVLLKPRNVSKLIYQNSYILILAVGMVLCILTGGNIDLSVGSVVAFISACSAVFSVFMGLPPWLSIILGLGMGLLAGIWQGFFIAYLRVPPFITTLAGMMLFRGINNIILHGETIGLPQTYITLASGVIPDFLGATEGLHLTTVYIGIILAVLYVLFSVMSRMNKKKQGFEVQSTGGFVTQVVAIAAVINIFTYVLAKDDGLPIILIVIALLIGIYTFITTKTIAGRHIYALGGNIKAAELSGVNTKKVMFWVYANMGLLAALAGIVFAGRLNSAAPTAGANFELEAIASCFIGGASATGGVGTVIGAVIGAFIMGILNNGMSIIGLSIFWMDIIKGLVLLAAVAFDVYSKSRAKKAV